MKLNFSALSPLSPEGKFLNISSYTASKVIKMNEEHGGREGEHQTKERKKATERASNKYSRPRLCGMLFRKKILHTLQFDMGNFITCISSIAKGGKKTSAMY